MIIKVLGTKGCVNCEELYKRLENVIEENKYDISLEKVNSILKISKYGITTIPALILDDTLLFEGIVPSNAELKRIIETGEISQNIVNDSKCCNGNCKI